MTLKLHGVSYAIAGATILQGIDLEVTRPSIVALVGGNGSGKSTLASIIAGHLPGSAGTVEIGGRPLREGRPEEAARLGVRLMPQSTSVAWNLTVLENLVAAEGLAPHVGRGRRRIGLVGRRPAEGSRIEEVLRSLDMVECADRFARELSFGQMKLLALGRILVNPGRVTLLDEPFAGLKDSARTRAVAAINSMLVDGVAIVIDHSLHTLAKVAADCWYLHRGRLQVYDDMEALMQSPAFREGYVGLSDPDGRGIGAREEKGEVGGGDLGRKAAPMRKERPVLSLRGLRGGYGHRAVIEDATIDVYAGDVVALIGLNGSGKSTILRLVMGLADVTGGVVELDGRDLAAMSVDHRVRVGLRMVPQEDRLFLTRTPAEYLRFGAAVAHGGGSPLARFGGDAAAYRGVVDGLRDIGALNTREASTLSGGERTRIALAGLGFGSTRVLLLDEPAAGLDERAMEQMQLALVSWRAQGVAVIIVEHDLRFVASFASRVATVRQSRLTELAADRLDPEMLADELMRSQEASEVPKADDQLGKQGRGIS
jgi:ribose transport system ATP-binding protein